MVESAHSLPLSLSLSLWVKEADKHGQMRIDCLVSDDTKGGRLTRDQVDGTMSMCTQAGLEVGKSSSLWVRIV